MPYKMLYLARRAKTVVELRDGEYRAVLEVSGTSRPFDDDVRLEGVLAGFATFLNGLSYRGMLKSPEPAAPMFGALMPFTFHANWTMGLNNKRALMVQTGTWLLT